VGSVSFDPLVATQAATMVRDSLARGCGGLMLVVGREEHHRGLEPELQAATVVLAGSATAVWASRLAGRRLPQRVRPTALAEALCGGAAADGRRVFVVGGAPGAPGVPSGGQRAAAVLGLRFRGLRIAGSASPPADGSPAVWAALSADIVEAKPDLVLVGLDAGAQEQALAALRPQLPGAWLLGSADMIDTLLGDQTTQRPRVQLRLRAARAAVAHVVALLGYVAAARMQGQRQS
jgi:N-acetylglucosaminyldiphosphoundecaprenol N-acetyl-beta-D-mannosaminyltransferase